MGKYMKEKTTDVALMDSSLGVRTRAKTLALQRLQKSEWENINGGRTYIQLRSRRLGKPQINVLKRQKQPPRQNCLPNPNPILKTIIKEGVHLEPEEKNLEYNSNNVDEGIEVSFGENVLEFEGRDRITRESTPCSMIKDQESIRTPGSTTRHTTSTDAARSLQNSMPRHIPTTNEMEFFFAGEEQKQQRKFIEKYNFDPVNDAPLPGRYDWVKLN